MQSAHDIPVHDIPVLAPISCVSFFPLPDATCPEWAPPGDHVEVLSLHEFGESKEEYQLPAAHSLLTNDLVTKIMYDVGLNRAARDLSLPVVARTDCLGAAMRVSLATVHLSSAEEWSRWKEADAIFAAMLPAARIAWSRAWLPKVKDTLQRWEAFDLDAADLDALCSHLDQVIADAGKLWTIHFYVTLLAGATIRAFDDFCKDALGDCGEAATIAGSLVATERHAARVEQDALLALARGLEHTSHGRAASILHTLEDSPTQTWQSMLAETARDQLASSAVRTFLATCGQRRETLDLSAPSWKEDPHPALEKLRVLLAHAPLRDEGGAKHTALAPVEAYTLAQAQRRIAGQGAAAVRQFEQLSQATKDAVFILEDHIRWIEFRAINDLRNVLLACGRRLCATSALTRGDDIFDLHLAEVWAALKALAHGSARRR